MADFLANNEKLIKERNHNKNNKNTINKEETLPILFRCINENKFDIFCNLLNELPLKWFNEGDENGNTCLHLACVIGRYEFVDILCHYNVNINKTNLLLQTPLHRACSHGHENIVRRLLAETKSNLNNRLNNIEHINDSPTNRHNQALQVIDSIDINDRLVHINSQDIEGDTPLHDACFKGWLEVVTTLLECNADLNIADKWGDTPLHDASYRGSNAIVEILIDFNANVNASNNRGRFGFSPLHSACIKGYYETVVILVNKGANIELLDDSGKSPLDIAQEHQHLEIVEYLREKLREKEEKLKEKLSNLDKKKSDNEMRNLQGKVLDLKVELLELRESINDENNNEINNDIKDEKNDDILIPPLNRYETT